MIESKHLRIVIGCVTFETVKIVQPATYYRADKVHLLHLAREEPYPDFLEEVERQLKASGIEYEPHEVNIFEFSPIMKKVIEILRKEKSMSNHVFVNISCGPSLYSAAALIACMMEGGIPFDVKTKEYMIDYKEYYEDEKPVGLTKTVKNPVRLPAFELKVPQEYLVKGLMVWKRVFDRKGSMSHTNIIQKLAHHNLMDNVYEDKARNKVSQSAIMRYQRNFLGRWQKEGWVEKKGRGHYAITPWGETILDIFGEEVEN